jgi:hypothetical protein
VSTKAINAFLATLGRAQTLLDLHSSGTAGRPRKEKDDILRAAVMLAVAGVDSYFHDKMLERLTPFLKSLKGKNLPDELIKLLEKNGGVRKLLGIMYEERPHRHIHTIIRKAQSELTFQKPDKIEHALKTIGMSDFWYKVAVRMGRRVSKDSVKQKLGQYAARRDKIAHEADRKTSGQLSQITRKYVRDCLSFIERFVSAADAVIDAATGG